MPPSIPDVEIFVAMKWIFLLMLAAGLMTLSGLIVKRWWYGADSRNRRDDEEESRGWLERFLKLQESHTANAVKLNDEMHLIRTALQDNGQAIRDWAESAKCNYAEHRR